jgi:hypothetical protein
VFRAGPSQILTGSIGVASYDSSGTRVVVRADVAGALPALSALPDQDVTAVPDGTDAAPTASNHQGFRRADDGVTVPTAAVKRKGLLPDEASPEPTTGPGDRTAQVCGLTTASLQCVAGSSRHAVLVDRRGPGWHA